MAKKQFYEHRGLDRARTMDEIIDRYGEHDSRKKKVWLGCIIILAILITIPFASTLVTHRVGLITQSGSADFTSASFFAKDVNHLSISLNNTALRLMPADDDTIRFQTSGARIILNYTFNANTGYLRIDRADTLTRDLERESIVTIFIPYNAMIDVYARLVGSGFTNDVSIFGLGFANLNITALNGSIMLINSAISGDLILSGQNGIMISNADYNQEKAQISSLRGQIIIE